MEWIFALILFISVFIYMGFRNFRPIVQGIAILFTVIIALTAAIYFNHEKLVIAITNSDIQTKSAIQTKEQDAYVYEMIKIQEQVLLNAPIISQFPELARGCEVTSLAMLLQFHGYDVDKLTLAQEIAKDPTTYKNINGQIFFGHPNTGFVGNMYSYAEPGLGVYHKPIKELAEKYAPGKVIDLTGSDFTSVQIYLSQGLPVWVITNTSYQALPETEFEAWQTPSGPIKITYKEHSVLLTGYDEQFVYFNDPLTGEKNKKAPMIEFVQSWTQMGSQAIAINH
ncbi:C39 family peptidase [Bacillus litorisediminis]|uniref:C39 family peptidase n=1 Tax=Bacillus litorisediminis TaxID=2922713 RepID=UPI001FAFA9A9|nr:C39 family peptidase [Bacillus litorisediminis]